MSEKNTVIKKSLTIIKERHVHLEIIKDHLNI